MKPKIYWYAEGYCYICQLPNEAYDENCTDEDWCIYLACGAGKTMREAYEDWLRDCEK